MRAGGRQSGAAVPVLSALHVLRADRPLLSFTGGIGAGRIRTGAWGARF